MNKKEVYRNVDEKVESGGGGCCCNLLIVFVNFLVLKYDEAKI